MTYLILQQINAIIYHSAKLSLQEIAIEEVHANASNVTVGSISADSVQTGS